MYILQNPCVAHGMSTVIGSVETGKLADLVMWRPAFFGAKPDMIIKGGNIAWSQMGDANASIPTPQPVVMRPMFAAIGAAAAASSILFVSQRCEREGVAGPFYSFSLRMVGRLVRWFVGSLAVMGSSGMIIRTGQAGGSKEMSASNY